VDHTRDPESGSSAVPAIQFEYHLRRCTVMLYSGAVQGSSLDKGNEYVA